MHARNACEHIRSCQITLRRPALTCCREALQDENDVLRDQLERCGGGASPPTLRRTLSAGSSRSLLASPLPGSPVPLHLLRSPAPHSPAQQSMTVQPHSPTAPSSDEAEVMSMAAVPPDPETGAYAAAGRHEHQAGELAAAHSRIAKLQQALQAAVGNQNGANAARVPNDQFSGVPEAEEMQQLRQMVRDAEADAAAAQDVARGAELEAEDARQQCRVLQVGDAGWGTAFAPNLYWLRIFVVITAQIYQISQAALAEQRMKQEWHHNVTTVTQAAWGADAQQRQEAADDLQRQLADVRAAAAEAAADAAAALGSAHADTLAADGARSAAEAAEAAAQAEAAQLRAQLQDVKERLQEAVDSEMALPERDDRLGWVAADVAGSPAAAANFAAAGTTHASPGTSGTDGPAAERQDSNVTELHIQARVPQRRTAARAQEDEPMSFCQHGAGEGEGA